MTNQGTLTKAITKAIENGWRPPLEDNFISWRVTEESQNDAYVLSPYVHFEMEGDVDWQQDCLVLCYSHNFAKALWGEDFIYVPTYYRGVGKNAKRIKEQFIAWKYHLQNMVIAPDPIKYLEEHL